MFRKFKSLTFLHCTYFIVPSLLTSQSQHVSCSSSHQKDNSRTQKKQLFLTGAFSAFARLRSFPLFSITENIIFRVLNHLHFFFLPFSFSLPFRSFRVVTFSLTIAFFVRIRRRNIQIHIPQHLLLPFVQFL